MIIESMVEDFLKESNYIEGEYSDEAYKDAHDAWLYLINKKEITPVIVKRVHRILMRTRSLDEAEKGSYRFIKVYVGGNETMNPFFVPMAIENWCNEMNQPLQMYQETVNKKLHVDYEKIHPFCDGNGRSGRMFMNWWRIKNGLSIMIIREKEKQNYYKWFSA